MGEKLNARGVFPSLTVNDVQKSKRFYVEGLGLTVKDEMKDDKGAVMGYLLEAGTPAADWDCRRMILRRGAIARKASECESGSRPIRM